MPKAPTCETCGAKLLSYKHKFNKGMAKGLMILHKKGGSAGLRDMTELSFNQKNNFQKIRYWGLIEKGESGLWEITRHGINFLMNKVMIQKKVKTFRGLVEGFEGEFISILDAFGDYGYWYRENYLENTERNSDGTTM